MTTSFVVTLSCPIDHHKEQPKNTSKRNTTQQTEAMTDIVVSFVLEDFVRKQVIVCTSVYFAIILSVTPGGENTTIRSQSYRTEMEIEKIENDDNRNK